MKSKTGIVLLSLYLKFSILFMILISLAKFGKAGIVVSILITILLNLFFLISSALSIINCIFLLKENQLAQLRKNMIKVKFGAVIYFIITFILWTFIAIVALMGSRGLVIFTPIPILFAIPIIDTFVSAVATSVYGIGFTLGLRRNKMITTGKMIAFVIFQFFFVLDVIFTIALLFNKNYKQSKAAEKIQAQEN